MNNSGSQVENVPPVSVQPALATESSLGNHHCNKYRATSSMEYGASISNLNFADQGSEDQVKDGTYNNN